MARKMGAPKGAKAKCDRLFSLIVRSRGYCENCGDSDYSQLECAHIFSRRFTATRTDESNALVLCHRCHAYYTDRPTEWGRYIIKRMGVEAYEALLAKSKQVTRKFDWAAEVERLEARWAEVQDGI